MLASVVIIQKNYRAYFWQKSLLRLKAAAVTLQKHWRGRRARRLHQHLLQQELRRKEEAEERRRREEEEQIRREEEERQWQEEEERRRKREEEEVKERYKMVSRTHSSPARKLLKCKSRSGAMAWWWHWNGNCVRQCPNARGRVGVGCGQFRIEKQREKECPASFREANSGVF